MENELYKLKKDHDIKRLRDFVTEYLLLVRDGKDYEATKYYQDHLSKAYVEFIRRYPEEKSKINVNTSYISN